MKPIFPYKTLFGDLRASVSSVTIDAEQPASSLLLSDSRRIDLSAVPRLDWETAALDVELWAPSDEVATFDAAGGVEAFAVAHSSATNTRQAMRLNRSDADPSKWFGSIALARSSFAGSVRIRFIVAGTVDGVGERWLGEADEWTVHFDEPPMPEFEGTMRVEWRSFSDGTVPELSAFQKEAFYASFDPERPTLYLNKDFDGLSALFREKRRSGGELALHEATRMAIATDVWGGLFNTSLASVVVDPDGEGDPDWPDVGWQENVLRALLDDIYAVRSPEDGLKQLLDSWRARGAAQIQSQLLGAIQAQVGARNLLSKSIRAVDQARGEER